MMLCDLSKGVLFLLKVHLGQLVIFMLEIKFLSLLNDQLTIEVFKDHFYFIKPFLGYSNKLHIVLFEVFSYVFCVFKGRQHYIISKLINAVPKCLKTIFDHLIEFHNNVIKDLSSRNVI